MARKFSLAYLTIPGVEALDQIKIAAEAGYDYVSLRTIPMGQAGEPQNILEKDPELFEKIKAALKDYNIKLYDIELLRIKEELPDDYRGAMEKGAELGAKEILSSVWTENTALAVERYGKFCEQAAEFGMNINLEFPAISGLRSLKSVMKVQDEVKAPNLKLLMDMLYVYWDEETPELLKTIDPKRFGVIHLTDMPKDYRSYQKVEVMRGKREYPGLGCVDLAGILKALPPNTCSIELPNFDYIKKYGAAGHAKNCLDHAKQVFAEAGIEE